MFTERHEFIWRIEDFQNVRTSPERMAEEKLHFVAGVSLGIKAEWYFLIQEYTGTLDPPTPEGERLPIAVGLGCKNWPKDCDRIDVSYRIRIKEDANTDYLDFDFPRVNVLASVEPTSSKTERTSIRKTTPLEFAPLEDGALVLELQVILYAQTLTTTQLMEQFKPKFFAKLQDDLSKALDTPASNSNSETKIFMTQDEKEFSVNRGVLSARSPVFERMFETKMRESETGIIRVTDINSSTMKVLLQFLYTGILLPAWSNDDVIVHLVYAAEKYQLPDLLEFLDHAVGGVCNEETGPRLLHMARKLELKKAEREIFGFMHKRLTNFDDLIKFYEEFTAADEI